MKTKLLVMLAVLTYGAAVFAGEHPKAKAKTKGALDGKVFVGEMGKQGEETGDKDEFIFKSGTFMSKACVPYGFHESAYNAKDKEAAVAFTAKPKNADEETMNWKGTVKGDTIEGTAVYRDKDGKETEYWFKGSLKSNHQKPESSPAEKPHKQSEHPEHPR